MSIDLLTYKICGQYPGGGVLLYISHITGAHKGCIVLGSFWSENGYKRRPFWSGIRFGFRGTYWSVCMNVVSFQFHMNKNEIEICEFEMHLKNFFVCALI